MKLLDFNKHGKLYIKHFDTMMSFERFLEKKIDTGAYSKLNTTKPPEIVKESKDQVEVVQSIQVIEHNYSDA